MTKPLALLHYQNLLPGSQLVIRLRDLGYRVSTVTEAEDLAASAAKEKPLVVITEIARSPEIGKGISALKDNPATQHIPVLAYAAGADKELSAAAQKAGASLLAAAEAVMDQLPQLLDHVLQIE